MLVDRRNTLEVLGNVLYYLTPSELCNDSYLSSLCTKEAVQIYVWYIFVVIVRCRGLKYLTHWSITDNDSILAHVYIG